MVRNVRKRKFVRKNKRNTGATTTRNILTNKSATAQSKQLVATNKRITNLAKRFRPEVKLVRSNIDMRTIGHERAIVGSNFIYFRPDIPAPGATDNGRIGNAIRLLPVKLFMCAQYNQKSNTIPALQQKYLGGQIRVIAVQSMVASNGLPTLADIMREVTYNYQPAQLAGNFMMTMPFKNGITTQYKILYDRKFNINADTPMVTRRISINPKIKVMRWQDGLTYPRGNIYVFILHGGFWSESHQSGEETVWDYTAADVQWQCELPYTDA